MSLIEVRNVTKRFRVARKAPGLVGATKHLFRPHYEEKIAIDHLNMVIEAGESVAYVGPNGAGKSTTIKMLTGIIPPSSGDIRVAGLIPYRQRIENAYNIGVVFGQRTQLWWDLPVQESLRLLGDIYKVPKETFAKNLTEMIDLLQLEPLLRVPTRQLSLGQRMRCDLAASLLHSPMILYLDEPTIGLDVAVKSRIRQFIKRANKERNVTVLLTSHDLSDIENLCTRLIMVDKGLIAFDGSLQDIQQRFGRHHVIQFTLSEERPEAAGLIAEALSDLAEVHISQPEPYQIAVQFNPQQVTAGVLIARLLPALPINDLKIDEPDIEDIIRQLYEGTLQFAEAGSSHGSR